MAAFAGVARGQSNPAAAIYDASDIEPLLPRYQKGWMRNYTQVFLPVFTAEERARLDGVQFRFEPRDPASEPFAFYSTRDAVFASASSLKFLDHRLARPQRLYDADHRRLHADAALLALQPGR